MEQKLKKKERDKDLNTYKNNHNKTFIKKNIILSGKNLVKKYKDGTTYVEVLKGVNINIRKSEFVAIMGPSGSGKSTLLHIIALLDKPNKGEIIFDNKEISKFSEKRKTKIRLKNFGYVFQDYNLLKELKVIENVALPLIQQGIKKEIAFKEAKEALEKVGLIDYIKRFPNELSGGQQQRVSIARAIVNKPKILFADEPTANLDSKTSNQIIELFKILNKKFGITIVMVTHEPEHKKVVDRVIKIKDGEIEN